MKPLIVIDLETTGLPGRTPAELLHIVEIGAVFVDRWGEIRRTFQELVNPGDDIVHHEKVQPALAISDITPELLIERGRHPGIVADDFKTWLLSIPLPAKVTAYNKEFDLGMLGRPPWMDILPNFPEAACIMLVAMDVMAKHCDPVTHEGPLQWLDWKGEYKWPKSEEAAAWLRSRGHEIPELRHHRALDDALTEVAIAKALRAEYKDQQ